MRVLAIDFPETRGPAVAPGRLRRLLAVIPFPLAQGRVENEEDFHDNVVTPAKAGVQRLWIPAFAGMTVITVPISDSSKSRAAIVRRPAGRPPDDKPPANPHPVPYKTGSFLRGLRGRFGAGEGVRAPGASPRSAPARDGSVPRLSRCDRRRRRREIQNRVDHSRYPERRTN